MSESNKPGLVVGALKPYQKQSLAFMLRLERAADGAKTVGMGNMRDEDGFSLQQVRGGWLADEVGMGKTVVTIALILANPLSLAKSAAVAIAADGGGGAASVKKQQTKKTKLSNVWKTTVVVGIMKKVLVGWTLMRSVKGAKKHNNRKKTG